MKSTNISNLGKQLVVTVLMVSGVFVNSAIAADPQVSYSSALEAFETAKAPDMNVMSKNLSPIGFAIEGDQSSSKFTSKVMKTKHRLEISTDALGVTHIINPDITYNYDEGKGKLELRLDEQGLGGEVSKGNSFFSLYISEECRQLATSSIICKVEMKITDSINMKMITMYKALKK